MPPRSREPFILLLATAVVLALSAWRPHDWVTWMLEVAPVVIGAPILIGTYRRFPLTPLVYRLLFVHACILILGAHYTYALVPIGNWAKDAFDLSRNHYDRIGHLAQGFIPAMLVREILIRRSPLRPGKWLVFVVICVCMAISVTYEFTEWWAALIGGEAADSFLGTQGDVWDTQWDMFLATIGASLSLLLLSGMHNRQLRQLSAGNSTPTAR